MNDSLWTIDIKLASILVAFDVPWRKDDPVTCVESIKDGKNHKQFTFWFDVLEPGMRDKAKELFNAFYKYRDTGIVEIADEKDAYAFRIAYDSAVTREGYINWMKNHATSGRIFQDGNKTGWLPNGASQKLKDKFKQLFKTL